MGNKLIAFSMVIVLLALATSVLVDAPSGDAHETLRLNTEETAIINERLEIYVERIAPNDPENATITVTDSESLESVTKTIPEGENRTYEIGDENVTVSVISVSSPSSGDAVDVSVAYSSTYGWGPGTQTIANNLGFILVAMAAVIVLGFVFAGAGGGL